MKKIKPTFFEGESLTLHAFKTQIKSWYPNQCLCRLCKTYVAQLGFI